MFDVKMRGYDTQQVDAEVDRLNQTLNTVNGQLNQAGAANRELQQANAQLNEQIKKLTEQNQQLQTKLENPYNNLGEGVQKVLADTQNLYREAENHAIEIKLAANKEAEEIRQQSRDAANQLMSDTKKDADKRLVDAKSQSERIIEAAQKLSDQTRQKADEYAASRQAIADKDDSLTKEIMARLDEVNEFLGKKYGEGRKTVGLNATQPEAAPAEQGDGVKPQAEDLEDDETRTFAQIHGPAQNESETD